MVSNIFSLGIPDRIPIEIVAINKAKKAGIFNRKIKKSNNVKPTSNGISIVIFIALNFYAKGHVRPCAIRLGSKSIRGLQNNPVALE